MIPALVICVVLSVADGDTLRADCGAGAEHIRIADLDAPERGGCGPWRRATAALAVLAGSHIWIIPRYRDRYGRTVADAATVEHEDIAAALIDLGLARPWRWSDDGRRALEPRPDWCAR
jgi:endonuclease YncB( thermonuclease family)